MQYVEIKNDTAILAVRGVFDFTRCKAVEADLNTAFQNGCTKVIVDFSNTKFIDSASIRQLCGVRDRLRPENFSARNASGKTLTVLRSENLDSWLKV
jgi:anti-anti-sigma factor